MDNLKLSAAKSIINSLDNNSLIDLYKLLSNTDKTFPAVICFNPDIINDTQYTKDLYQFILDVIKIYNQGNNILINNLIDGALDEDVLNEYLFNSIYNRLESGIETLEEGLQYIIDNIEDILKLGNLVFEYSTLFKIGFGLEESAKLIEFLDKHNASRFFLIKNLPLYSLNILELGDNYDFYSHKIIYDSSIGCFYEEHENRFIYIFV